jgi:hypothetical protein
MAHHPEMYPFSDFRRQGPLFLFKLMQFFCGIKAKFANTSE